MQRKDRIILTKTIDLPDLKEKINTILNEDNE